MMVDQDVLSDTWVPPITTIPLKLVKNSTRLCYSSAIARQAAAQQQRPVFLLASQIAAAWNDRRNQPEFWRPLPLPAAALPHLNIFALSTGLIQIELTDPAIATWLNFLLDTALPPPVSCLPAAALSLFPAQHAHARCCSLLRLAHEHQLICLKAPLADPMQWGLLSPEPIPWLTPNGQLQGNCAVDLALIQTLFTALDRIWRSPIQSRSTIFSLAAAITQAFHTFHSAHPLFGNPNAAAQPRIQAQLGLLLITQRLLRWLLEDWLQVIAPIEL
jgi:hypothetical protein